MNQTLSLYRLQQTDSQISRAQVRIQTIQKTLEDDEALLQASKQAEVAEKNKLALEHALRQAENTVGDQHTKMEQTESSLYSGKVHHPKELQDLQNDVVALKRYLATLEDRQLEAMLAYEEAESINHAAQANLQAVQAQLNEHNKSLKQEQGALQREIIKLEAERQAISNAIPPQLLESYNQLRRKHGGVAVAAISDHSCTACGSNLTPAEQQAARSATQMAICPSCGRILYGS